MSDGGYEKRFAVLCEIVRAQHFAWREAVARSFPGADTARVVQGMWRLTGERTADAYLRRLDPSAPLTPQVAESFAWSSRSMGEDAVAEVLEGGVGALVRHRSCPWLGWHHRMGLVPEDRPGCDAWFQGVVARINEVLGTRLRVETLEALPEGAPCCLRRLWEEGKA